MNIVLIGIQGCGKGTLVAGLEKHYDFDLISVGQLLRDEVATGSELGKTISSYIDKGFLVPTEIIKDALDNKLKSSTKKIMIFDGFPRNAEQAELLDSIANVDLVLHLKLDKEIAIQRIVNRLTCKKCGYITRRQDVSGDMVCPKCGGEIAQRVDDAEESVKKRLELYEKDTYPLLDRYRALGVVADIEANREPKEVLDSVLKVINEYNN